MGHTLRSFAPRQADTLSHLKRASRVRPPAEISMSGRHGTHFQRLGTPRGEGGRHSPAQECRRGCIYTTHSPLRSMHWGGGRCRPGRHGAEVPALPAACPRWCYRARTPPAAALHRLPPVHLCLGWLKYRGQHEASRGPLPWPQRAALALGRLGRQGASTSAALPLRPAGGALMVLGNATPAGMEHDRRNAL